MAGEYRQEAVLAKLPGDLASRIRSGLRIGLTSQPMIGVEVRRELIEPLAIAFAAIGQDKYADGLRSGTMLPLEPVGSNKVWAPGELFFNS